MNKINLVPAPFSIKEKEGFFQISEATSLFIAPEASAAVMIPALELTGRIRNEGVLKESECTPLSDLISEWIAPLETKFGHPLSVVPQKKDTDIITLHLVTDKGDPESYRMEISQQSISITASGGPGLFYAIQSLLQITGQTGAVPACIIEDKPRFSWRGLHLDCGRFFQPLDEIRLFIDNLALHKMNVFHWHLTEDQGWRLEIKKYPCLTEIGSRRKETGWGHYFYKKGKYSDNTPHSGFYSQEEVKEIVRYARNRGVMILPEIDLPGHSRAAIAAYPALGVFGKEMEVYTKWGICEDIYNPEDSTISFLEDVMKEVLELFPSPWIHIGGDEAVKNQWKKSQRVEELLKERGLKDSHELQSWFIRKIASFLEKEGRKTIGWDEIMEGGAPEKAVIMAWQHEKKGMEAVGKGHAVLMCPCQWTYLDAREERNPFEPLTITEGHAPLKHNNLKHFYSWNPLPQSLNGEEQSRIMGGQGQVWTEYIPGRSMLHYLTWPRASALAEVLWTPPEKRNFQDFERRLQSVLEIFDGKKIAYRLRNKTACKGSLKKAEKEWQEQQIELEGKETARRVQILFRRKGWKGYGEIDRIKLECPDGRVFTDSHRGYCGDFNRLNVYTLGDGSLLNLKGCRLTVRYRSCALVPSTQEPEVRRTALKWICRIS